MLIFTSEQFANCIIDVWFHRYENGRDIEGRFDYNSWQESEKGLKLAATLDKDTVLAEGKPRPLFLSPLPPITDIVPFTRLQRVRHRPHLHGQNGRLARRQRRRDPLGRHRRRQHPRQSRCAPQRHQFPCLLIRESSRDRGLCEDG